MRFRAVARHLRTAGLVTAAGVFAGARIVPGNGTDGPVLQAATAFVSSRAPGGVVAAAAAAVGPKPGSLAEHTTRAVEVLARSVRPLSHPRALQDAFRGYYAFRAAHPEEVRKPYLYFVDYGLPSTEPRGYLFDMEALEVVEGPFTVAHGRGSSASRDGVPTRFTNAAGSSSTSLGLYLAQETYSFHGHAGGQPYSSVGLRLQGLSTGFNDRARERGVVAHGAPYVTPRRAGRSQGCPAMEPERAQRLLPRLAEGGMVFLFAPDSSWMARDPWLTAAGAD